MAQETLTFGRLLKESRLKRELTLRDAAKMIGISIGYLSDIENGRRKPPADNGILVAIEKHLDTEPGVVRELAIKGRQKDFLPTDVSQFISRQPEAVVTLLREVEEVGNWEEVFQAIKNIRREK
jgi:transcriptional regulator with XRE-family HTH domain